MREWEQGWSSIDKDVCAGCLSDPALAGAVQAAADAGACDYCDRRSVGGPVDVVLKAVVEGLRSRCISSAVSVGRR